MCVCPHADTFAFTLNLKTLTGDEGEDVDLDAPKIYEPIESYEQLSSRFQMFQAQYNDVVRGSQMDLVFFKVHIILSSIFH